MSTAGADFPIDRIATDDVADVARIAAVRDAYRRTIAEVEIAPHPVSPFYWRGVLRRLPGLALASAVSSGARITRTPTPDERDDLILTVAVEGRLTVRQGERETVLRTGEMAVTRSREASRCERDAHARSIELRIPSHAIVPTARELDAIMVVADRGARAAGDAAALCRRAAQLVRHRAAGDAQSGGRARARDRVVHPRRGARRRRGREGARPRRRATARHQGRHRRAPLLARAHHRVGRRAAPRHAALRAQAVRRQRA